jgi:Resolvase, N terminal domain/Tn3 transposase DDE domain
VTTLLFGSENQETFAISTGPSAANGLRFAKDITGTKPQNRIFVYARVSTYGQTLDTQLAQLKAASCARVYREKATGSKIERRELRRMLKALAPGDVVTVTRIDRLARSTFDLFSIVKQIVVNTLMLQRVLAEPAWMARMTPADMRGLMPLLWGHVSPYGTFDLDMEARFGLDWREAA